MADSDSGPVGTEQSVIEDGVFDMSTVGAMNTNVRNQNVTEISHVPADKYVYLLSSQSGNELSFVSSQPVTSDKALDYLQAWLDRILSTTW